MSKFTPSPVGNFNTQGLLTLQANLDAIEEAFDNTISRDGSIPNQMESDLDLNNNDLLNGRNINGQTGNFEALYINGVDFGSGAAPVFSDQATSIATKAMAEAWSPTVAPSFVRLEGYYSAVDGGGGLYALVVSEPDHVGKFQTANGYWYELEAFRTGSNRWLSVLQVGIRPNEDCTALARALYEGPNGDNPIENMTIYWPPGDYEIDEQIYNWGDNVWTYGAGRDATTIIQNTWGRPVFANGDPLDTNVRPNGQRYMFIRFEAWIEGELAYFHDALYGPESVGITEYNVTGVTTTATEDNLFVLKGATLLINGVDYVASGFGTSTIVIDTTSGTDPIGAHGADEYVLAYVTNKWDLGDYTGHTSLYGQAQYTRANESTPIWHGGGDNLWIEGIHTEGFVAIVTLQGDWTSNDPDRQSRNITIQDVTFNNCEFLLHQECTDIVIKRLYGGKITLTQTDGGIRSIHNPSGDTTPAHKPPHEVYGNNSSTSSHAIRVTLEDIYGDNVYSSHLKQRNCDMLTVRSAPIAEFQRVCDFEGINNLDAYFPSIDGSFDRFRDSLRTAINLWSIKDGSVRVGQCHIESDVSNVIRFRDGDEMGDPGVRRYSENVRVTIDDLFTEGTSARTTDWIVSFGGIDCWSHIKRWVMDGADTGHMYRARANTLTGEIGPASTIRGGIQIDVIELRTARTLKVARLTTEEAVSPEDVTIIYDRSKVLGTPTYDSSTISDAGTRTRVFVGQAGPEIVTSNAPFTLTVTQNAEHIIHTGTVTVDRQVTLSTSSVRAGMKFRITRSGGGAGNLLIGTGPLATLATGTWCEVTYDGSAWVLTAYGALS